MSLTVCPECQSSVSASAVTCPSCGHPIQRLSTAQAAVSDPGSNRGNPIQQPQPEGVSTGSDATIGKRAGAEIIDGIIVLIATLFAIRMFFPEIALAYAFEVDDFGTQVATYVIAGVIAMAYTSGFEANSGQTLGKMFVGIRVTMQGGSPCTGDAAFRRNLAFFAPLGSLIAFVQVVGGGRGFHDRWAGTSVVETLPTHDVVQWPNKPQMPTRVSRRCLAGHVVLDGSFGFCPECGAQIVAHNPAPVVCPNGHSVLDGAPFCPTCGLPADSSSTAAARTEPYESSASWPIPGEPPMANGVVDDTANGSNDAEVDERDKLSHEQPEVMTHGACPHCGTETRPGKRFCSHCGSRIEDSI